MEVPKEQEAYQAKYVPKQTSPKASQLGGGTMRVNIASYPPLGQVTVLDGVVDFVVVLEIDEARVNAIWEVALWYSSGEGWMELLLTPSLAIATVQRTNNQRLHFSGKLVVKALTNFTLKFRVGSVDGVNWKWARDNQGAEDGTIIPKPSLGALNQENLPTLIGNLNPDVKWEKVLSETPRTSVWSLTTRIDGAQGRTSAFKVLKLGRPWHGDFIRWFAILDKDAIMCSFLDKKGRHLVIYAISGIDDILTVINSDDDGDLQLSIRNDRETQGTARIVVALGDEFELANAAAMYQARSIVTNHNRNTVKEQAEIPALNDGIEAQWMENWYDGLTYCTWNGLGQHLTEENVYTAVDTLAKNNINITNLIIDDNWQNLDYQGQGQFQHGWSSFEADPKTFPNGLRALTSNIRLKHPNIQHIAVWHALWGYWGGIDPRGEIANSYKTVKVMREEGERRNLPLGGEITIIAKEEVARFYDDFYQFLRSSGVDAVKTDAQFMFDTLKDADARRDLFNTYLDAWTTSSLKHFSVKAISCMSQTPQILYHSQMPTNRPPILVRNSDDFFPEVPSSHTWHVWTNAHNALLTQHLNLLPDWDMFQTVHDYSGFHAAARCVSGGPIYVTDVPGQHDIGLINQMTGKTTRNKTIVFRPSVVGKSLDQYVSYDDEVLLKVVTYHGAALTGTSIIGIFNTTPRPLTELIPLSKFAGTTDTQLYVIRAHSSGAVTTQSMVSISLEVRGYDILSAYPLRGFTSKKGTLWLASLGLLGKMAGAAAIVNSTMTMNAQGKITIECSLKALGTFGLYVSDLSSYTIEENLLVTILGQVVPMSCVSKSKAAESVLEVDIERAWAELDLNSGWSNEVRLSVLVMPYKTERYAIASS